MSKTLTFAAALVAGAFLANAANALDIVNKDTHNHNVRITLSTAKPGDKPVQVKVAASATAQFDCSKGCTAHLGKKDDPKKDVVLKGTEKTLTIEKDKLSAL